MGNLEFAPIDTSQVNSVTQTADVLNSQLSSSTGHYVSLQQAAKNYKTNKSSGNNTSSDPNVILSAKAGQPILRYPLDTPPYFLSLFINKYTRPSIFSPLSLNAQQIVVLPMPSNLLDASTTNFSVAERGTIVGLASEMTAASLMGSAGSGNSGSLAGAAAGLAARAAQQSANIPEIFLSRISGGLINPSGFGSAIAQQLGVAPNPFLTVELLGPNFKQHAFQWTFSPETPQESYQLKLIINTLKKHSLASLNSATGGVYLGYPDVVMPVFYPNSDNLYIFKYCVITGVTAHYAPSATPSFFAGTKAATSVVLGINLLEIEMWFSNQYSASAI